MPSRPPLSNLRYLLDIGLLFDVLSSRLLTFVFDDAKGRVFNQKGAFIQDKFPKLICVHLL